MIHLTVTTYKGRIWFSHISSYHETKQEAINKIMQHYKFYKRITWEITYY